VAKKKARETNLTGLVLAETEETIRHTQEVPYSPEIK
jgi:hypothetical protein